MSFAPRNSKPVVLPPLPRPPTGGNDARASFRDAANASAILSKLAQPKAVRNKPAPLRRVPSVGSAQPPAPRPAPPGQRIIDDFTPAGALHQSSSTGTELQVAQHNLTGAPVVLKAADRRLLSAAGRVSMAHATPLHRKLEHDHIIRLHEVFDSERFVQVLEWVPGITLDQFMQTYGCGPEEAQQIVQQLVSAVAYMHADGVCHRDIRLSNVMLRQGPTCCVKLIDFGSCGPADKLLSRRVPCNPLYAPPELMPAADPALEYSGKAADVWALGIVLHVLLTGEGYIHTYAPGYTCIFTYVHTCSSQVRVPLPPSSFLLPPNSHLLTPTSYLLTPTSDLRPPTSHLPPPTSYLLPPTSYHLPPTSYLLPPISCFPPQPTHDMYTCTCTCTCTT